MISVDEALQRVLAEAYPLPPQSTRLAYALHCVLAESVASDVDSPPYDKSVVDGYAVQAESASAGRVLRIIEEVTAGLVPTKTVGVGQATCIMTGAPIPPGADAVVMVEKTTLLDTAAEPSVQINAAAMPNQNIMRQASSMRRGETVLRPGKPLTAVEIGLLAEVGHPRVIVQPKPRVAILATGNELVGADEQPGPGQIRNSNGPLLTALVQDAGGEPVELGVARDEADHLRCLIEKGLGADVLLLSGGVSEGVLDLAPRVLAEAGVRQVFHKVNIKPGKPLWFGVLQRPDDRRTLVFGLPGNPVSTLVSFLLFARPAIAQLAGREAASLPRTKGKLTAAKSQRGDRPTYWPFTWENRNGERWLQPLAWRGSGDLRTLAAADGLAVLSGGGRSFDAGDEVDALYWR